MASSFSLFSFSRRATNLCFICIIYVISSLSYTWNYIMYILLRLFQVCPIHGIYVMCVLLWLASLASPPSLRPSCCYSTALCFNTEWSSVFFVHLYGDVGKLNTAYVTCLCGLPWVRWRALVSEHGHWKPPKMHVLLQLSMLFRHSYSKWYVLVLLTAKQVVWR